MVDELHFEEVVARAERAALLLAAGQGAVADLVGVGAVEPAVGLGVVEVARRRQAAARMAAMYFCPSGLSTGAQASWRSGRSMPYFSGALRSIASASSQTW